MSKAYTLATLATGDLATQTDLTDAIDGIVIPDGGKVMQVKNLANGSASNTSSTSWSDATGTSLAITPTANDSKILVTYNVGSWYVSNTTNMGQLKIVRVVNGVTSDILSPAHGSSSVFFQGKVTGGQQGGGGSISFLDDPQTTDEIIYKVQIKSDSAGMNFSLNKNASNQQNGQYMTLMEIAA